MRTSILFLALLPILVSAQPWCPPGATWTYTHTDSWTYDGMARYQYIGDTVIAGSTAQIISLHTEGYYWPWDTVLVGDGQQYFTRVTNDLVDLWTGAEFDTLYDFAAVPGDHWYLNMPDGVMPFLTLTVQDTGRSVVDGLMLRYLVTTIDGWSSDTIFERLGSLPYQFVPWAMGIIDAANGPLRCYGDVDINYHSAYWNVGCDSYVGMDERGGPGTPALYPNPGTTHFTLDLPHGPHTITLFDATGRMVLQQRTADARPMIDTEALPAGLYRITVRDAQGGVIGATWVKE